MKQGKQGCSEPIITQSALDGLRWLVEGNVETLNISTACLLILLDLIAEQREALAFYSDTYYYRPREPLVASESAIEYDGGEKARAALALVK